MIFILVIVLIFLMTLIGGERGVISYMTLFFNGIIGIASLFFLGHGFSPILILVVSSILFIMITVFYQNGFQLKTLVTFISTMITVMGLSTIIYYICIRAHITGLNEIAMYEDEMSFLSSAVNLDMSKILLISMIWGELGAVIDTSMSISSAMNEIRRNNHELSKKELFQSGMTIGKDILGTTINTLVFVAFGESMMVTLYYVRSGYTIEQLLNSKSFFQEAAAILLNCIGCIGIIPLTALVFILLEKLNPHCLKYLKSRTT